MVFVYTLGIWKQRYVQANRIGIGKSFNFASTIFIRIAKKGNPFSRLPVC
jgi:hypothetical protein